MAYEWHTNRSAHAKHVRGVGAQFLLHAAAAATVTAKAATPMRTCTNHTRLLHRCVQC